MVYGYDTRQIQQPIFTFQAHEKACSSLSFSPHVKNLMATCSTDETIRIWDIGVQVPKLIAQKKMAMVRLIYGFIVYRDNCLRCSFIMTFLGF